jgi:ABC-type polysaccharide/polyol phosphate transport system ATPase subunit
MEDVQRLCDAVVWIDHGSPKMLGKAEEVTAAYMKILE